MKSLVMMNCVWDNDDYAGDGNIDNDDKNYDNGDAEEGNML